MSRFNMKQGKLVQKSEYINFPNENGTITKLPTYCIIPADSQIPSDISDNKKYPNVYMVNHVVFAIGHLKPNGQSFAPNCSFYNDCISTSNQEDIFELIGQPIYSIYPLHEQARKQQLKEYVVFTEAGLFKAVLMASGMPNAKAFLTQSVSLLQDIKENNVQLTGFTEDSRIKKLIKDNNLTGIMESIMNVQRNVLDVKYGKTEFMNKLANYTNKKELITEKMQYLKQQKNLLTNESQASQKYFISEFMLELSELNVEGLETQIQQQNIQIDGHIYSKEVSLDQIKGVCEQAYQEVISKIISLEKKDELRKQLDLSYKDIEAMKCAKYIGQSRQNAADREQQHNLAILSILNLEVVRKEPKYLKIANLLLEIQEKLPSTIQRNIGRLQPESVFQTTILHDGIDNQETLNRLEMKKINETPNNLNTIKYVTYNDDSNRIEYQKYLAQICKITTQIEESQQFVNGLKDTLNITPNNLFVQQSLNQAEKSHKKLVKRVNELNNKRNGLNVIIQQEDEEFLITNSSPEVISNTVLQPNETLSQIPSNDIQVTQSQPQQLPVQLIIEEPVESIVQEQTQQSVEQISQLNQFRCQNFNVCKRTFTTKGGCTRHQNKCN